MTSAPPGRVAGIDFGTVRIGIALSDASRTLASPFENYTRRGAAQDAQRFRRLVSEEDVSLFVIGLPVHTSGAESQKSREARAFGQWLQEQTAVPIQFYDERYSSIQAEALLQDANLTSKQRKKRRDMLAAQLILSAFLEADSRGNDSPGPIAD